MRKKCPAEKKGGAPGWMVTYGDMMSLLLTFFVLLVSMSSIQESKFKQALGSLLGALGVMRFDKSVVEFDRLPIPNRFKNELHRLRSEIRLFRNYLKINALESAVTVQETDEGMLIRLTGPVLFDSGSDRISPQGRDVLNVVAKLLSTTSAPVRIEGHTDNLPVRKGRFSSNWELSTARAIAVLKFLNENGIPGSRLSAAGYGEFRPIVPNDNPENRRRNRRVEIYVDFKDAIMKKAVESIVKEEAENG